MHLKFYGIWCSPATARVVEHAKMAQIGQKCEFEDQLIGKFLRSQHIHNIFAFVAKKYQANPCRINQVMAVLLPASNWVVLSCLAKSCAKDNKLNLFKN